MNITAEEKLIYDVMKAIYDSGIPVNFKGSMVLKACLMEAGYSEDTRHTVDIDANWYSESPPTAEQMTDSLQKALDKSGIDLKVGIYRMYGEGRSAGFELTDGDSGEVLFTMDVDVNRPVPPTKIYEVADVRFCGVAPIQMIADKVAAVSSEKVFRRIKDVVDLYYISHVVDFDRTAVLETLKNSGRQLESFNGFLHRSGELRHSYEKFRFAGGVNKPPFEEVYQTVKAYIKDVLPKNRSRDYER
ncbi:MAG: nucleotidyl transferase AbiEii/AbiGii toxin family protein [Clostridia bacterium]|nr:nucleotidyl transferase AbiEii/AbiGii toxin family protein [Clostridia bacterium]